MKVIMLIFVTLPVTGRGYAGVFRLPEGSSTPQ